MAPASTPSALGLALGHPLNLLLLGAAGVSAVLTGSWLPLAVGAGAELLWLAVGRRLGRGAAYFEYVQRQHQLAERSRGTQARLSQLSEADRRRYLELDRLAQDIQGLVAEAGEVEREMLAPELEKVRRLVEAFLELAARAARYEAFVGESDVDALEAEARRQEALVARAQGDDKALAVSNLEVLQARLQRGLEVRGLLKSARGQLNLVENTLRLLRDQVASMDDPGHIAGQLDELVQSVEAIEASAKETRALEARVRGRLAGERVST
jgi:hypothetical protein